MKTIFSRLFGKGSSEKAGATSSGKVYTLNDQVSFLLPKDCEYSKEKNDDGEEYVSIKVGKHLNDEGEPEYNYECSIFYNVCPPDKSMDDTEKEEKGNPSLWYLPCKTKSFFVGHKMEASFMGMNLNLGFKIYGLVRISDNTYLFINSGVANNTERRASFFEGMLTVLKSIQINGEKLSLDGTTAANLEEKLILPISSEDQAELNEVESDEEYTCGDYTYKVTKGGKAAIVGYDGTEVNVSIPHTLDGYPVTVIDYFSSNDSVQTVSIPRGVTEITDSAFINCSSMTRISIADTVTSIGANAFNGCEALEYVLLSNAATSIGANAFDGCTSLDNVCLPDSVTSIGSSIFNGCTSLHAIKISASLKEIPDFAFNECSSLINIIIPDSVTSIGEYAFSDCTSLGTVIIPYSVIKIADGAFLNSENISLLVGEGSYAEEYARDEDLKYQTMEMEITSEIEAVSLKPGEKQSGDYLYTLDQSGNATITGYYGKDRRIDIPTNLDGHKVVSISSFSERDYIINVTIPGSVSTIEKEAFIRCTGLRTVTLPDSLTSIGDNAFDNCCALTYIHLPDSIPSIDEYAFAGCSSLKQINIPKTLTTIRAGLFQGCSSLDNAVIPKGVKTIEKHAFNMCSALTSILIPDSVTAIGGFVFMFCSSLEHIDLPKNLTSIEAGTFSMCSSLKDVDIPESVGSIGHDAFSMCSALESITIPDSVHAIEERAFSLSGLTEITLPASVQSIGEDAFPPAAQLIVETGSYAEKYAQENDLDYQSESQSERKAKLKRVNPPEELYPHYAQLLGNPLRSMPNVFINEFGTEFAAMKLADMIRDEEEEDDEDEDEAEKIKEKNQAIQRILEINTGDYRLAETARNMIKLFRVDQAAFDPAHDREEELRHGYMRKAYMLIGLRSFAWTLADYCKTNEQTPESTDLSVLVQIADHIAARNWLNFDGKTYCRGLCSGGDLHIYYIPDGTTAQDKNALLPTQEALNRMEQYGIIMAEFHSLDALRKDLEYIYPAVKTLYNDLRMKRTDRSEALEGNTADVVYAWIAMATAAEGPFFTEDGPANYRFQYGYKDDPFVVDCETEIPEGKYRFKQFVHIAIPEGVISIGKSAFEACMSLKNVKIANTVQTIGNHAFFCCKALQEVAIPNSVTKIENAAFYGCDALKELSIPKSVIYIGGEAFGIGSNIKLLVSPGSYAEEYAKKNKLNYRYIQ